MSFTVEHARVRDILDKFASMTELRIWVVTYPAKSGLAFGRIRATKSLYSKSAIPQGEQPTWATIIWGYDPITQSFRQDWYERKMTPDLP